MHGQIEFNRRQVEPRPRPVLLELRLRAVPVPDLPFPAPRKSHAQWPETARRRADLPCFGRKQEIFPDRFQLGVQAVGRSRLDRLFISNRTGHDVPINLSRRTAVKPEKVVLGLGRDDFVALARQDVEGGLGADDLARRCDQRWIAHVLAHPRHFVEHFFHTVQRVLFGQLRREIRQHAARNLRGQNLRIDSSKIAFKLAVPATDGPKVR